MWTVNASDEKRAKDNVIPITDEEYLEDDIVGLLCAWLKKTYGVDTLEENLDFIAAALGNKGDTSREIMDVQRISGPVHLHGVTRRVLDAHGGLRYPRPLAIFLTELGVLIRLLALRFALCAVFGPEQRQIDAGTGQITMDLGIVRGHIGLNSTGQVRKQDLAPLTVLGVTAEPQDISVVYHIVKTSYCVVTLRVPTQLYRLFHSGGYPL
jgi:hypothetical protein